MLYTYIIMYHRIWKSNLLSKGGRTIGYVCLILYVSAFKNLLPLIYKYLFVIKKCKIPERAYFYKVKMNMASIIRDQPMYSQEIIAQYKSKVLLLV